MPTSKTLIFFLKFFFIIFFINGSLEVLNFLGLPKINGSKKFFRGILYDLSLLYIDEQFKNFLDNQKSKTETVKLSKALDTYIQLKGNGKGELFHRTALRNISYTIECFGDVNITSLKSIDAARYRDFLFKKGLSTSSVRRIFRLSTQ